MPETDRRNRPRPPPPEPTRQPTTEEPTRQPTNNEELIYVSTVEVNEITDIATELEKLTTGESTPEGVTDQIREMATELDEGATVEPIVIMPESDEVTLIIRSSFLEKFQTILVLTTIMIFCLM